MYLTPGVPKKNKTSRFVDERSSYERIPRAMNTSPRVNDFFIMDVNEN